MLWASTPVPDSTSPLSQGLVALWPTRLVAGSTSEVSGFLDTSKLTALAMGAKLLFLDYCISIRMPSHIYEFSETSSPQWMGLIPKEFAAENKYILSLRNLSILSSIHWVCFSLAYVRVFYPLSLLINFAIELKHICSSFSVNLRTISLETLCRD